MSVQMYTDRILALLCIIFRQGAEDESVVLIKRYSQQGCTIFCHLKLNNSKTVSHLLFSRCARGLKPVISFIRQEEYFPGLSALKHVLQ